MAWIYHIVPDTLFQVYLFKVDTHHWKYSYYSTQYLYIQVTDKPLELVIPQNLPPYLPMLSKLRQRSCPTLWVAHKLDQFCIQLQTIKLL